MTSRLGFVVLWLWFIAPAGATVLRHVPLGELVQRSAAVVEATAADLRAEWDAANGLIRTSARLRIFRVHKAPPGMEEAFKAGARVTWRGGWLRERNIEQAVPGAPTLEDGRAYLLFLGRDGKPDSFTVTGMFQGAFELSGTGGRRVAERTPGGAALLGTENAEGIDKAILRGPVPLQRLRDALRPFLGSGPNGARDGS